VILFVDLPKGWIEGVLCRFGSYYKSSISC